LICATPAAATRIGAVTQNVATYYSLLIDEVIILLL